MFGLYSNNKLILVDHSETVLSRIKNELEKINAIKNDSVIYYLKNLHEAFDGTKYEALEEIEFYKTVDKTILHIFNKNCKKCGIEIILPNLTIKPIKTLSDYDKEVIENEHQNL